MIRFLVPRLAAAAFVTICIVIGCFFLLRLVPGDPVSAMTGDYPVAPEYIARLRHDFGLDRPVYIQLWLYIQNVLHGNLGFSFVNRAPVVSLLFTRAGRTLDLMIPSLMLSSVFGVLLALIGARSPGGRMDNFLSALTLIGYSIPVYWLGQLLIIVFAVNLHWLPAQGIYSLRGVPPTFLATSVDFVLHWLMPAFAITLFYTGIVARVARASLREIVAQDFMATALAKGLTEREAIWKHALPNALIPVVTVIGYNFGHALTGTIMVEAVFAWPGLGGLFLSSITSRDYPTLQGIFLLSSLTVVIANMVTDIAYGLIDPRIRHHRTSQ